MSLKEKFPFSGLWEIPPPALLAHSPPWPLLFHHLNHFSWLFSHFSHKYAHFLIQKENKWTRVFFHLISPQVALLHSLPHVLTSCLVADLLPQSGSFSFSLFPDELCSAHYAQFLVLMPLSASTWHFASWFSAWFLLWHREIWPAEAVPESKGTKYLKF